MSKVQHIVFDHDGTLVDTSTYKKELFSGILEVLEFLKSRDIICHIWTARNRASTVEILRSLAIIDHFHALACSPEMNAKPSPEGIESLLIDSKPSEVMVIGDSLVDMIGGKSYGALTVGALWAHGADQGRTPMLEAGADICFVKVLDLKKYIESKI